MDRPGARFLARLRAESRARRRGFALTRAGFAWAALAPACVLVAVFARTTGASPFEAAGRAIVSVVGAFGVAVLLGVFAALRSTPRARAARALDAVASSTDAPELFVSALHAVDAREALAPAVLSRADEAERRLPGIVGTPFPRRVVSKAMFWLALAFGVAFAPAREGGLLGGGAGGKGEAPEGGRPKVGADVEAEDADDPRPELRDVARLRLKAGRAVLAEDEQLMLGLDFIALRAVAGVVPVETVLAVADGLPSPDQGFGVGWRVARLNLDWKLPSEEGGRVTHLQAMNDALTEIGLKREGLLTIVAAARVSDSYAPVKGGILSDQIVVRFSPNVSKEKTETPAPSPKSAPSTKASPDEKKSDEKSAAKGSKPELGAPEELPDVDTYAALVKPLLNEGPNVEKDVAVYERERGGEAPPPPTPLPPPGEATRPFERLPEAAILKPTLTPAEREALRRYFALLRTGTDK